MKLDEYVAERRARQRAFNEGYDEGRERFALSQAIVLARQDAGMSRAALARAARVAVYRVEKVENRIEYAEPDLIDAVARPLTRWLERYGWFWQPEPNRQANDAGRTHLVYHNAG